MSSYLSKAAATLEYENNYCEDFTGSKTVELISEEFNNKTTENNTTATAEFVQTTVNSSSPSPSAPASSSSYTMTSDGSLPPLTYTTTTTIPTIANQPAMDQENSNVLYCNLDDLSRYIPDNFSFDQMIQDNITTNDDNVSVQVLSLPTSRGNQAPNSSVQIQLRPSSSVPSSIHTLTIPR